MNTGGSRCPDCGKLRYLTRREARKVGRRLRGRRGHLNAYKCGEFYHLGHLPMQVIAGDASRDDLGPRRAS